MVFVRWFSLLRLWTKSYGATIQIKSLQQYFHMVLFISYVVLTFDSLNQILWCDHSKEISLEVLSCGVICFKTCYKMKFGIFVEFAFGHVWQFERVNLSKYSVYCTSRGLIPVTTNVVYRSAADINCLHWRCSSLHWWLFL